ncbi:MerR family transcriptional regulator [Enterococcus rivorum]|uniref:Transcriptional regulator n=1 Tax=Enterococcus rivorum TaxID=762845 RepID=A0A1E5KT16_9ENTE|nr:MerR family transcriptional regulator [Enterococcus rivorum]MBP2098093.1 DNA-binding transcriptional MerR regulator [Enterococcus rivorum]OEH81032.1 transcriptional regulator [Enterococcus rivorum]
MEIIDMDLLKKMAVTIGEAAKITGVPIRKLRYWEDKGIIQSVDGAGNVTRKYDYYTIKKIILIKELVDDGYVLDRAAEKVELRIETLHEAFKKLEEK